MASAKMTKPKASKQPTGAKAKAKRAPPAPPARKPSKAAKVAKPEPVKAAKGGIDAGSRAPSFTLKDQSGKSVSSSSLAGAPYVLYFYPKDNTTGCTKQACGFRDSFPAFGKVRARVLGVSPDSEASHAGFVKKHGLPFTLLADPEKVLANAYGVWGKKQNYGREYMGISRSTFVVDAKGVVQKAWRNVRVDGHVDAVLEAVQALE
jgi:peroxiredoxin Q/BCP